MVRAVSPATLAWMPLRDSSLEVPFSLQFNDIYFSGDGYAESCYVFLKGNRLPAAWQRQPSFRIAELGFGTGLNFLISCELWRQQQRRDSQLHYIATERYPLLLADLIRAHRLWPHLRRFSLPLLQQYPPLVAGCHRVCIAEDITLDLLWGDSSEQLLNCLQTADLSLEFATKNRWIHCWYLDGFAPLKNPENWTADLFELIARLSLPDASLATFSAAGQVRRHLQDTGFEVDKVVGFGSKRSMLTARFQGFSATASEPNARGSQKADLPLPKSLLQQPNWHIGSDRRHPPRAIVIGAGIAGCTIANALARRHWDISLLDAAPTPGGYCHESQQQLPQVAVQAKLSLDEGSLFNRFCFASLRFAETYYRKHWELCEDIGEQCGLVQLALTASAERQQRQLAAKFSHNPEWLSWHSAEMLQDITGIQLASSGLWFHNGWRLDPQQLCRQLVQHSCIEWHPNCEVHELYLEGDHWQLSAGNGTVLSSPNVIVCAATQSRVFEALDWLPLKTLVGQLTMLTGEPLLAPLKTILCAGHTLIPECGGGHVLGSSYRRDSHYEPSQQELDDTLAAIITMLGSRGAGCLTETATLKHFISSRATTPDYLPIVSAAPDLLSWNKHFSQLSNNARFEINTIGPSIAGLFINAGYGSRGFCYAPLAAEILASELTQEPIPVPLDLKRALHAGRFLMRQIIRRRGTCSTA